MMRIALKVEYADGSGAEVMASAPDLIAFERHFDKPMMVFAEDVRIEYLLWLAWTALKRKNLVSKEFDAWTEDVEAVIAGGDAETEIVPLELSQPIG
jgi:hypothetical protein